MTVGLRVITRISRVDRETVERFRALPVANISDAMGRLSAAGPDLRRIHANGRLVGPAVTVRVRLGDNLMIHKAFDVAQPGDVIVVDAGGELTNAVIGENSAAYAESLGLAGLVINGAVRDVATLSKRDFPIFAAGITHRGPHRQGPGEVNLPIALNGMVVCPGDLIVADDDGVLCVPREGIEDVYQLAQAKQMKDGQDARAVIERRVDRSWVDVALHKLGCEID